jgi:hypothetical protein
MRSRTMVRLPGTAKITFVPEHSGDHEYNYAQYPEIDETLQQEDIAVTGNWKDFSGSGNKGPTEVMMGGVENYNDANLLAKAEGIKDYDRTIRGNIQTTVRSRPRIVAIDSYKGEDI